MREEQIYLKSIDLFGFKTFADRTHLEFQPGISGIVGPNGSGKSNFVDAVRWVLGEQSARQLRGARMDDVIFAGNTARRPLGMAEVTLTFDNSDGALATPFSETAITRRVYRTGESEFFLNKSQVRLRDITDLLLGTGLAAELAAIVSQGEIDAILSAKPEQRRELFEGVAGTSRYRVRKREAQRRLEQTAVNALRLNDLLTELEKQIPAIEQQVRRAKRYHKVAQQLRELEVLSYLRKTTARREERSGIVAALGEDDGVVAAAAAKQRELQSALNKARYDEYQASMELDERNAAHAKAAAELQEHASAQSAAQAKSTELARQCETLAREVDAAAQAETDADATLSAASEDLRVSRERRDEALSLAEAAAAAEAQGTALWERAYAELRSAEDKRARAAAAAAESSSAAGAASAHWQRLVDTSKRLEAERASVDAALAALAKRGAENERALAKQSEACAQASVAIEELEAQRASTRAAFAARQADRDRAHEALAQSNAKLAALTDLATGGPAGSKAAQLLWEARKSGQASGIVGTVAQHITVAKEYNLAIDALLGERAGDIVVQMTADAQRAVALLKAARAPRATVIVLAGVRAPAAAPPLNGHGIVGDAAALVRCTDERLQPVVDCFLHAATVVESLAVALELASRHSDRLFATLDGDVVRAGAITTGAISGPLSLRAEIAALTEQRGAASKSFEAAEHALRDAKRSVEELESRLVQAHNAAHATALQRHDLSAISDHCRLETRSLEQRREALDSAMKDAKVEADGVAQLTAQHRARADVGQVEVDALETGRRDALNNSDALAAELNELRARHRSAAANAAALVERVAQLSDDVEAARLALTRAQQQRKLRGAALQEARAEAESTSAVLEHSTAERARAEAELATVQQDLETVRARRDERAKTARELETANEQAQQHSRQHSLESERLRIRLAEIDAELSLLAQTFAQNPASEPELEAIAGRYQAYEGDADADVRRLRDEMVRLGNVNLNALEDRAATLERCEFLRTQLADLETARAEILKSIAEMDAESLRQFNAAFEKVSVAFSETFTRLFNGGNARMWISEADDPTEAGIEISAQPPGKKMQHLNLLSGGERALTAVALIFATLQVRPSPFYIFDEIDAALDEANIGRFGGLLGELASRSQIIIITHNKATMTLVERMYGITMGEPGVSSILSLALERAGARG